MKSLICSKMSENCVEEVSMIDKKGFVYCETCGKIRKFNIPTRKLTKKEINQLTQGSPLSKY